MSWASVGWTLPLDVCGSLANGDKPFWLLSHVDVGYVSGGVHACVQRYCFPT